MTYFPLDLTKNPNGGGQVKGLNSLEGQLQLLKV
jgi:hypothetical protein